MITTLTCLQEPISGHGVHWARQSALAIGADEPERSASTPVTELSSKSSSTSQVFGDSANARSIVYAGEGGAADGKKAKAKSKAKAPPSSSLPLTLAPKVRRDMLLLETADPSLDLSGDFGIIGRLSANAGGSGPAVTLDLKGKVSDGDVVPCNTMCVLAIDGAKARIETVFTDFVQLQPPRTSIMDMETVTTGDLGGDFFDDGEPVFGDDSDEEAGPLREGKAKAAAAAKGKGKGKSKPKAGAKRAGAPKAAAKKPPAKKAKS